jgi:hypothetical protein
LITCGKQVAIRPNLAAHETRTFAVQSGTPKATAADAVAVTETAAGYEPDGQIDRKSVV